MATKKCNKKCAPQECSRLQQHRGKFKPVLPNILKNGPASVKVKAGKPTKSVADQAKVKKIFPHTYGMPEIAFVKGANSAVSKKPINAAVVLSGGQAPGGHNVIAGLLDGFKKANSRNKLFGFLGGPSGVIDCNFIEITPTLMDKFRNTGGFDLIQSGRTKIETDEQLSKAKENIVNNKISAFVVVGGDDSNTNAGVIAEYLKKEGVDASVIGVPKTIDGDLKNEQIETSFGFDTATKTYSELVGNIERDANSAKKYWHFIKLMGRSATHVGLEVALQTQPNITLISEEVEAKKMSLKQIVDYITDVVVKRSNEGKNFGVALIPEGLIEFIPEMKTMISNLNDLLAVLEKDNSFVNASNNEKYKTITEKLDSNNSSVFNSLPDLIKAQLLMDRDPHGNVQVSKIETEKLLIEMVKANLKKLKAEGKYQGKFSEQAHFFGYEGRCAAPSNFDADYCYSLGYNAFALILGGFTGYLSCIKNLTEPANKWMAGGVPLTMMMNMEKRHGKMKPVIQKALVELDGPVFKAFEEKREKWALNDCYVFPGAIQYFGPSDVCDVTTMTLQLEQKKAALTC